MKENAFLKNLVLKFLSLHQKSRINKCIKLRVGSKNKKSVKKDHYEYLLIYHYITALNI